VDARELFRAELARRGVEYAVTGDGRWLVNLQSMQILVSLDNLDRQLTGDGADGKRVAAFASQVLAVAHLPPVTGDGLYWFAEPNDYPTAAKIRAPISPSAGSSARARQR
jgi:hypothetical protein